MAHLADINRGKDFSRCSFGTMRAAGFRMAQGGRPGDGYSSYPGTEIEQSYIDQSIKNLFNLARVSNINYFPLHFLNYIFYQDTNTIMENVRIAFPEAHKAIKNNAESASTLPLGKYGLNTFYCWNYVAPQHTDMDRSFTISIQLEKSGESDEYNFACSEYGFYIETQVNTLW